MSVSNKLTNLKNNLQALLDYSNSKTGVASSDLGEAIRTLADGYLQYQILTQEQYDSIEPNDSIMYVIVG